MIGIVRSGKSDGDRRYKIAKIRPELLLNTLIRNARVPGDFINKYVLDLPDGTELLDRWYNHQYQCECILLYHTDWANIPCGEEIPEIYVKGDYVRIKATTPTENPLLSIENLRRHLNGVEYDAAENLIREIQEAYGKEIDKIEYDTVDQCYDFRDKDGNRITRIFDFDDRCRVPSLCMKRLEIPRGMRVPYEKPKSEE